MKKFFTVLSAGAIALVLTACNTSATPEKGTTATSKLTLEQVYDKAVERQADIKSMSANMDTVQKMKFIEGEESMEMNIDSQLDIDMIAKPLAVHLSGTMTAPDMLNGGTENSKIPVEMYMKPDQGFFLKDPTTESWTKIPSEEFGDILDQTAPSANVKEQLDQLKQFIDNFTFKQTDDTYVLTLNAQGDAFKEFIQAEMDKSLGAGGYPLDGLTFDKANYVIYIDKETFNTNKIDTEVDLQMKVADQEVSMQTKTVVTYSKIDNIDSIDIPQSIIDTATVIED